MKEDYGLKSLVQQTLSGAKYKYYTKKPRNVNQLQLNGRQEWSLRLLDSWSLLFYTKIQLKIGPATSTPKLQQVLFPLIS